MNELIKKINVNDFEVVKPAKKTLADDLHEIILSNAKSETLNTNSFKSILKAALDLAYTNGHCDEVLKKSQQDES